MKKIKNHVVTRFAPSPTGVLHIGGARTALFNYLFAKQNNGKFILRIEDTDAERSKKEFEDDIKNGLEWLGLRWDEFYKQSERKDVYKKYIEKLLEENKIYISKEETGERQSVIRFRNPNREVSFADEIRGDIKFDTTELGDFIIAKDKETPLYHLAVVIDDFEMGITHIIRGEDGISNTPRQILIQEAIDAPRPIYGHIPLILGPDRAKMSKRHGATSLSEYRNMGYIPKAIINFMAFMGWNPGTNKEVYSIEELIKDFSLKKVQKSGAIFNFEKLDWLNKEYLKKINLKELENWIKKIIPEKYLDMIMWEKIFNLLVEDKRIIKLFDIKDLWDRGELNYFFEQPDYKKEKLLWRDEKSLDNIKNYLEKILSLLNEIDEDNFMSENIKEKIWDYANEKGKGNVLWPFRFSLTGLDKTPDPFVVSGLLGKKETIKRLQYALNKL